MPNDVMQSLSNILAVGNTVVQNNSHVICNYLLKSHRKSPFQTVTLLQDSHFATPNDIPNSEERAEFPNVDGWVSINICVQFFRIEFSLGEISLAYPLDGSQFCCNEKSAFCILY